MVTSHPTQLQFEMWHAGEPVSATVVEHLGACAQCASFVRMLERERELLLASESAGRFVARLRRVATSQIASERWWALRRVRGAVGPCIALAGATAMAVIVAGKTVGLGDTLRSDSEPPERPAAVAEKGATAALAGPDLVRKGRKGLELIVHRDGEQVVARERFVLQAGDELRLRFQLAKSGRVSAGILERSGRWVPFFEAEFAAGLHTPEATLRVDTEPSSGRLIFGSPEDVSAARAGKTLAGVQTIELGFAGPSSQEQPSEVSEQRPPVFE